MKKFCSFLIVLLFVFLLVGCGEKITITINDADKAITLEEGKTQKVTPVVSSAEAILEWSTSDETIAKVSNGTIEAVTPGEATITVSVKDQKDAKATIQVTVTEKIIYEVNVDKKDVNMVEGSELTINPTYTKNTTLKWETSDDTVVKVENGKLTALKPGFATVKVSIVDHAEAYARINVTVLSKLVVDQQEVSMDEGSSVTLNVTHDEGTTLVWASSDEEVATVANGVVTGVKPGDNIIFSNGSGSQTSDLAIPTNADCKTDGKGWATLSGEIEDQTIRVYFTNPNNWSSVYAYSWGGVNLGDWPGTKLQKDAVTGYYYVDGMMPGNNIIFSNNSGSQTGDLVVPSNGNCVFNGTSWVSLNN